MKYKAEGSCPSRCTGKMPSPRLGLIAGSLESAALKESGGTFPSSSIACRHHVASSTRSFGLDPRRTGRWTPDDARQKRRFGHIERRGVLVEVPSRGRLHAEITVAEINAIQIGFENLILGVSPLDPESQQNLTALSRPCAFAPERLGAHQLLGDRACPLRQTPGFHVVDGGASHADDVDTHMRSKVSVLGRKNSRNDRRRELVKTPVDAFFFVERKHQLPVAIVEQGRLRPGVESKLCRH